MNMIDSSTAYVGDERWNKRVIESLEHTQADDIKEEMTTMKKNSVVLRLSNPRLMVSPIWLTQWIDRQRETI